MSAHVGAVRIEGYCLLVLPSVNCQFPSQEGYGFDLTDPQLIGGDCPVPTLDETLWIIKSFGFAKIAPRLRVEIHGFT